MDSASSNEVVLTRSFAIGLLAYLRQADLSIHRAPGSFSAPLRAFYAERGIPAPDRVLAELEALEADGSAVARGRLRRLIGRLSGSLISLSPRDIGVVRRSLTGLCETLKGQVEGHDPDRWRIRTTLSHAQEPLRRRLRRRDQTFAMNVEHLNQNACLSMKPLGEIAGSAWPESGHEVSVLKARAHRRH
jgi:hypothetical protein